jgi:hypothetical protein
MSTTDERIRNRRAFRNPMFIIGAAMTVFYITLGALLLANARFLPNIPAEFRQIFAVMVLVYGAYRGWRAYMDYRK